MPVTDYKKFKKEDVYIDYSFEEVMFRWDCKLKKIYRKFYGEQEFPESIKVDNRLYTDALLYADEIDKLIYIHGKDKSPGKYNE